MIIESNRDLWFTLPPQRSLLVTWLFSVIPILILKFSFFNALVYFPFCNLFMDYAQSRDSSHVLTKIHKLLNTHPEARKCLTKNEKNNYKRKRPEF